MLLSMLVLGATLVAGDTVTSAPVAWTIDRSHSELSFRVRHLTGRVRGYFKDWSGTVTADPAELVAGSVSVEVKTASINTEQERRDTHLRSKDFLDVEKFPDIIFESVRVEATGRRATVTGRLTLRGISKEIAVPVDVAVSDVALVATGELVMNRRDYGMDYNSFVNPIGNEVRVNFTIRARAS